MQACLTYQMKLNFPFKKNSSIISVQMNGIDCTEILSILQLLRTC